MIRDILAIVGGACLLAMAVAAVVIGGQLLLDWIGTLKHQYRYKHRFDKPPTAKCYCIDCVYHSDDTGRCWRFGETTKEYRCTADNWFCWEAEPRKKG